MEKNRPVSYAGRFFYATILHDSGLAKIHSVVIITPMLSAAMRFLLFSLLLMSPLIAGDKNPGANAVSFHMETDNANNPKMIFERQIGGKLHYFQKSPDFTHKDMVAFSPFLADNQVDFGVVLQLRPRAARRLESLTTAHQGKLLLATCNGRVVDIVRIDQPVSDGFLVIWNGVQDAEIKQWDKVAPRIGQKKKKN